MRFDLTKPCGNCPFRNDRLPFGLRPERVREILGGRRGRNYWPASSFVCHKTVDYARSNSGRVVDDSQHCAGVMIILHRENRHNDAMQIAERLGFWDPANLDMDAPVYATTDEAIRGNQHDSERRKCPSGKDCAGATCAFEPNRACALE